MRVSALAQTGEARLLGCPACGRTTAHAFRYRKNGCDIFACAECGLGRTETASFDPQSYYTQDYFSGGHADGYGDYAGAEPVLRREFAGTLAFIRTWKPAGKLIEVGCAYGFFLEEARSHFDVSGVELAEDAAAACRARGLRVLSGVADEETLQRLGPADVIVLLDVIEHLPDPHEVLARCTRFLHPGGIVVLTTGDFASPLARWAGPGWRLMTPPQHLWFFTRTSMERLAARLGLQLASFAHPWKTVPLSLVTFQLRRMAGLPPAKSDKGGGIGMPVNLFDAMRVVLRKPE